MQQLRWGIIGLFIVLGQFQGASQIETEIKSDGIVVPSMAVRPSASSSSFAQLFYNTTTNQYEFFDGTSWQALQRQDKLEDADGDSKIVLQEFGGGFPDQIEFRINNTVPMKLEESPAGSTRLYLDDGQDNVLIGELAGNSISTGTNNTFIGQDAGKVTIKGSDNVAVGKTAGQNIRNGQKNVTIGTGAGFDLNSGEDNVAIGHHAGRDIDGSSRNVFIGSEAGLESGTGASVMIGTQAGKDNEGFSNTFIGTEAGRGSASTPSTGNQNVAIGNRSGISISLGSINTIIGAEAGSSITTGNSNVAIGYAAGRRINAGTDNVMIGAFAGDQNEGQNNVLIGRSSGSRVTGNNNIFLGTDNGTYSNVSNQLFIGSSINDRLIMGEFDNETVTIHGDLQIHPKGNPGNNSHLRMADSNGHMDEVIRRSGTNNSVVMGDVNNNGGDLHLRSSGTTSFSVLADGTAKFWPMSTPPGSCNTSRRGQVYFDSDDNKLKTCGQKVQVWGWWEMF